MPSLSHPARSPSPTTGPACASAPLRALLSIGFAMLLALAPTFDAPAAASEPAPAASSNRDALEKERFVYRWELRRLASLFGGLFFPDKGDGVLTFTPSKDGLLRSELLITSPERNKGEFWRYGAEIDPQRRRTVEAWSSYKFRGEESSKREDVDERGVLDVASGIWEIRRDPPTKPRNMRIWSDGKIYPVVVIPGEATTWTAPDGKAIPVRHFEVRGRDQAEGREWKGSLELWLTQDGAATPVQIEISRSLAAVRLELASLP